MDRPSVPQLVFYTLAACLAIAVIVAASTSGAAFGAYNPAWDGTSDLRDLADQNSELTVALDVDPYRNQSAPTIAIVLAPSTPYSEADTATIRRFVENGGTLLVADNFGSTAQTSPEGNVLLADVGASARFDGDLLRDEQEYDRSPALPVAGTVSSHPYTQSVDQLTLNYGTAVEPNGAEPLVQTSRLAYLDRNRSGSLDGNETLQRYPVVTVESVGDGQVIAVGDPSLFINTMLEREDNGAFVSRLFQTHERVILDYSASDDQPPLSVVLLVFQNTPLFQGLVGAISVSVGWIMIAQPAIFSRLRNRLPPVVRSAVSLGKHEPQSTSEDVPQLSEAELQAYLQQRYPEWDDERLQRIVAAVIQEETRTTDNE